MERIKVIAWDVFGTVVDWRGSIAAEGKRVAPAADVDWDDFAVAWADEYGRSLGATRRWTNLDVLLASAFHRLAGRFGLDALPLDDAIELSTTWGRFRPWPDAVSGFAKLAARVQLVAFSNASATMLRELAHGSGLPWAGVVSAEEVRAYKPSPAIYRRLAERAGVPTSAVCLAAAHCFDLNAAAREGFRTALISRTGEPGSDPTGLDHVPVVVAADIDLLAGALISAGVV